MIVVVGYGYVRTTIADMTITDADATTDRIARTFPMMKFATVDSCIEESSERERERARKVHDKKDPLDTTNILD